MKNEAVIERLPVKAVERAKTAGLQFLSALVGFIFSRSAIMNGMSPFGVAAAAAMPANSALAAGLGAVLGYIMPFSGSDPFRYIVSVVAVSVCKWLLSGLFKFTRSPGFSSFAAFVSLLATGVAMNSVRGMNLADGVLTVAEALLSAGTAYFLTYTVAAFSGGRGVRTLSHAELASMLISFGVLLISLAPLNIGGVSPARIFACLAVLTAARYGREAGGAIAGAAAGFAMSLAGGDAFFAAAAFSLGGLLSGVFARFGRIGCGIAFVLANAVAAVRMGGVPEAVTCMYEVFAGTVIFTVLPRRVLVRAAEFLQGVPEMPRVDGLRKSVVNRLRFASGALCDVSQTVDEVSARLRQINAPALDEVFAQVEGDACTHCKLRVYCWETARGDTLSALIAAGKGFKPNQEATDRVLPEEFSKRCARPKDVAEALSRRFARYQAYEESEARLTEVRSVVSDQFTGVSEMLDDLAAELEDSERFDPDAALRVEAALKQENILAADIGCFINRYGRMTVEIELEGDAGRVSKSVLMNAVCEACNREFDVPAAMNRSPVGSFANSYQNSRRTLITVAERARLAVDFGAAQLPAAEGRLCGDAFDFFNDGKGRALFILSDGMGNGGRAAVDGAMASGLTARLLKAGFGFDCSLKIVNSAMLFKSTDESIATLDICCVDLFSGAAQMYKAGAPGTYWRKNGKAGKTESQSLPAGILRDTQFEQNVTTLGREDILLLVSDGVCPGEDDWLLQELENWRRGDAQALAEHIADSARRRREDGHSDDITVLAGILMRN
ncbi:MAG: SpoIIE family protein phosphatase [Oscillospiraceae bacterium]|jgi:stage II sporulation protein E|nr:SpoIIE family protein phosphatase [Oscillospiraceae bacterium]